MKESGACAYVVTAHKSTAVSHSCVGNFTSKDDVNLIIGKQNRIGMEINKSTDIGLKPVREFSIYGKIEVMRLFRYKNEEKDCLFILTERCYVMILEYSDGKISTRAYGDMRDKNFTTSQIGVHAVIDPEGRIIALRLFDGVIKVINLNSSNKQLTATTQRIDEIDVLDMQFLHTAAKPTLCLLYQDQGGRHVSTYTISTDESHDVDRGPFRQSNVDTEAALLIAVPDPAGVLIIGHDMIAYHDGKNTHTINTEATQSNVIYCTSRVDKSRYLCGDTSGGIMLLHLDFDERREGNKMKLTLEYLGHTTIPNCISYVDNYVVFIGSLHGDSELIRIQTDKNDEESYLTKLASYDNLGPIKSMVICDLEKQGQGQLVTATGVGRCGSLRIIRNGVGIQEFASIDLPGTKGVWTLNCSPNTSNKHDTLLLAFVGQTLYLRLDGEEVSEITEIAGFTADEQTLHASNLQNNQMLQITEQRVRLVGNNQLMSEWVVPEGSIALTSVNQGQILLAIRNDLIYLEVENGAIVQKSKVTMDNEIACIDCSPIVDDSRSNFCAVGLWNDISVSLLGLPDLRQIDKAQLSGDIIPRSLLISTFCDIPYLFVSIGDGALFYYRINDDSGVSLGDTKRVQLGNQPTTLTRFKTTNGSSSVFACSDRPAVIHSSNQKIFFSNVNLKHVNHMCQLDSSGYENALALVTNSTLLIGTIDEIQKLHTTTIPLNETPWCVAHQDGIFAVLAEFDIDEAKYLGDGDHNRHKLPASLQAPNQTGNTALTKTTEFSETAVDTNVDSLIILDEKSFMPKWSFFLDSQEIGMSILTCKLGQGDQAIDAIIIGTSYSRPDESDSKKGRIIVFQWTSNSKLEKVCEKVVESAVYSLSALNGKFVATIQNQTKIFELTKNNDLQADSPYTGNIIALYSDVSENGFILVGDLMRSLSVLSYKQLEGTLEEVCRDYNPNWMTAVKMIDDENFIGAENSDNLFFCQKNSASADDDERSSLKPTGFFHTGQLVNCIVEGSLVMSVLGESSVQPKSTFLFGSSTGYVGLLAILPEHIWNFLHELEGRLRKVIKGVGRMDHELWRRFTNDARDEEAFGVVDGDLVEQFFDLSLEKQKDIISTMQIEEADGTKVPANYERVVRLMDDLARLH